MEGSNSRGRTPIEVHEQEIADLIGMKMSVPKIAEAMGVSIATIRRRMKESGLSVKSTYSALTDAEIDQVLTALVLEYPNLGIRLMKGMLWSRHQIRLPEQRLRDGMRRVDPVGVANRLQANRAVVRREYNVPHANYIWHVDTYLKLNRYNMVVQGAIDGKSRACIYLNASSNNKATTSLDAFISGVDAYGVPLRCRTDKGSECILLARFMLTARGLQSHIAGKSVRNQRIERYWGDVKRITSTFFDTFQELEEEGGLSIDNGLHMTILHYVYIPRLNAALEEFRRGWNDHPLSSERNYTPNQLFILHACPPTEPQISSENIRNIYNEVMEYAPVTEPADRVRYLQDPENALDPQDLVRLRTIDIHQFSPSNGKDVYYRCLNTVCVNE